MKQVAHLKGPEKEGKREPVYFATHANYVDGLEEKMEEFQGNTSALSPATKTALGGVIVGDNISVTSAGKISVLDASTSDAGVVKLYNVVGNNTDGAVTPKAVKNALENLSSDTGVFTGATSTAGGAAGLVPAPAIGDQNKFLRGDGTWATVSGGSGGLIQIGVIPSQANTVTYNGSPQTCNWNDYDPVKLAMDGDYEATEAGDHTVGFTPQSNCVWTDGTQDRKTATWTISKAAGSLSISANSGSVDATDKTSFTITAAGDGEITVISDDTGVATVSRNGNTVEITGVKAGTATITVSQAAGTNHTAPANKTYAVTVMLSSVLNNVSWADISVASKAGTGDTYWDVGDAKEITLNGKVGDQLTLSNTKLCVFILHFNYAMNGTAENNIIWSGFKSALTGGKDVGLVDAQYGQNKSDGTKMFNMNHWANSNKGGWKGCDLRYDILGATSQQLKCRR